jgi:hypothetical protein
VRRERRLRHEPASRLLAALRRASIALTCAVAVANEIPAAPLPPRAPGGGPMIHCVLRAGPRPPPRGARGGGLSPSMPMAAPMACTMAFFDTIPAQAHPRRQPTGGVAVLKPYAINMPPPVSTRRGGC